MGILVRKNSQLVFYARAIPWSLSGNHSGEHRRILETGAKSLMNLFIGVDNEAWHLGLPFLSTGRNVEIGKLLGFRISSLLRKCGCVD